MSFSVLFVPVGVGTYEMNTARAVFERSRSTIREICECVCPDDVLLTLDSLKAYCADKTPDAVVFQNITFANAAYAEYVAKQFTTPIILWTPKEPAPVAGRLLLNCLTGAFAASNAIHRVRGRAPLLVFGWEKQADARLAGAIAAVRLKLELAGLTLGAVGEPPEGFGFGAADEGELMRAFGVKLARTSVEDIIEAANRVCDDDANAELSATLTATTGLERIPAQNQIGHARLLRAYKDFVRERGVGVIASRCWPDFFTKYGTPVCAVLSMLGDMGIPSSCECDAVGALSMYIGASLSGFPTFFGDPVALDEKLNAVTFWHCGMAPCSLAREDTGAAVGVHPNRKIGPVMDFGCKPAPRATVLRLCRREGGFAMFAAVGEVLDAPKSYNGTSMCVRLDADARRVVEGAIDMGLEPHYAVARADISTELEYLAALLEIDLITLGGDKC